LSNLHIGIKEKLKIKKIKENAFSAAALKLEQDDKK
jgi:hypothetical protein